MVPHFGLTLLAEWPNDTIVTEPRRGPSERRQERSIGFSSDISPPAPVFSFFASFLVGKSQGL